MVCGIIFLIFGILAVVNGKFSLTRNRIVSGWPARTVGIILIVDLPLLFLVSLVVVAVLMGNGRKPTEDQLRTLDLSIGFSIHGACLLAAIIIALIYARPRAPLGSAEDEEEFEAERSAARRRRSERGFDDFSPEERDYPEENPPSPRRPPDERIRE